MKVAAAVASTTVLALGLTACGGSGGSSGSSSSGGVTTMTWQMWSGSEIETETLNHLSEMVTQANPDIKLTIQTSTFPDYWTKLAAQASGGDVGCILGVQGPRAPSITSLMLPLEQSKLEAAGIKMSEFNPAISQALQSDGQQIAIPYDFGPLVVFYNKDLFAKAGLKEPSTTWTVDEFEADARKLTTGGKNGYGMFPTVDQFAAWTLTRTGQQPIDASGKLQIDTPGMVDTFSWLQGLQKDGVIPQLPATTDTNAALNEYIAGNTAMVVDGPWQYGNIVKTAKFKPGVAVIPVGAGGGTSHIAGSGYGVSKSCKTPDAALKAIATITGPEAEKYLGEAGRAYPARTAQSDAWYVGDLKEAKPALDAAIAKSEPFHSSPTLTQIQTVFQQYGIPALNGQQPAADFLKQVQQQAGGQ
ncbi:multiple sugar transport system substrate-binding protein [Microlunatus flavus]|uniref:Multiple sugar transport system substrate-binding protein n=2 Tax=Microlunatus flavus TaxID=1036181 RepID=A0A1H9B1L3_9ACTN|nr:multiple sugar transport system substrate-binding protein [Microlunatus flavus]